MTALAVLGARLVVGLERRRLAALVLLRLVVGLVLVVALGQEQEQCRRLALAVKPLRQAASPLSLLAARLVDLVLPPRRFPTTAVPLALPSAPRPEVALMRVPSQIRQPHRLRMRTRNLAWRSPRRSGSTEISPRPDSV